MLKQLVTASAILITPIPALAQNASEIAAVQNGQSCTGCNLFQADLAYMDLDKIDVSGARLRQADLQLSTFDGWDFSGTNLSVANLFGTRFNRSSFKNANFQNAALVGTYFGNSNLEGADLTGANASGADFSIAKGMTQSQLNKACGDDSTRLPKGMTIPVC
ncbi:pentapeptide repeat-containing protein [Henriciella sp.]|uniref:pentapeptide repeat-containing protein n=1 Tax=Henriciella sp. TaxID=1968823 RepID=UPI00260CCBBC|nr:pentapeptide repeat-containing protein [Henriciella sp.]